MSARWQRLRSVRGECGRVESGSGVAHWAGNRRQLRRSEGVGGAGPAPGPEGDRRARRLRRVAARGGEKAMTAKILVLAGRRSAALDPLAKAAGVTHKCLVPVRGEAMVGRVLRTAADAWPEIGRASCRERVCQYV